HRTSHVGCVCSPMLTEELQRFLTRLRMVHNGSWIVERCAPAQWRRLVQTMSNNTPQLRQPLFYIFAIGIAVRALCPGIQNAEIGHSVSTNPGAPLPPTVVAGDFAVGEFFHEIALSESPIEEEVLG